MHFIIIYARFNEIKYVKKSKNNDRMQSAVRTFKLAEIVKTKLKNAR